MRVLVPNLHGILTASLCQVFAELGITVYVPGVDGTAASMRSKYADPLAGAHDFREDLRRERPVNCRIVPAQELPELDVDAIFVTGHGVQRSVLRHLLPALGRRREVFLAYFCGNELPHYRWDLVTNLLCADEISWQRHGASVANAARYYPWIDYRRFAWHGPSDERRLVTCIGNFEARYPRQAAMARAIVTGVDGLEHRLIDGVAHDRVGELLREAAASLHIKPEEGYGYAVIESLACGRPIVAPNAYVRGRAMQRWCLPGETSLLFDTVDEARQQLARFFGDGDFRHRLQQSAAASIRRIVDNDEQKEVMRRFIERLQPQKPKTALNHLLDLRHGHRQYLGARPLDPQPAHAQDGRVHGRGVAP